MKRTLLLSIVVLFCVSSFVSADTFGTGANQFTIDFVSISGSTNPASGYGIVNNSYRMGTYEITNDQWNKFQTAYGTVTGSPLLAYDESPYFSGENVPTNTVSWYEGAQFVNYLNMSTGHQAAYKFTGTQGTSNYTFSVWEVGDTGYDASNPYRNSNAIYFLPTEDEWVKAAYWNGIGLQSWATVGDVEPTQSGWNYYASDWATDPPGPWDVGSGSEELNGTYDMMGNVWEWLEGPFFGEYNTYGAGVRGGPYDNGDGPGLVYLESSFRSGAVPDLEHSSLGFRVASVPEPASISLLALASLAFMRKRKP